MAEEENWTFKRSKYHNHPDKSSEEYRTRKAFEKEIREMSKAKINYLRDRDPCAEEGDLSRKCLVDNLYDKSKCADEFENVRNCRKFWKRVEWARFLKKEKPYLPGKEDRDRVFEDYKHLL